MIRYRLHCEQGHEFEGWFPSSSAYDAQAERGLLSCATCGSDRVEKALMAPSVQTARGRESAKAREMAKDMANAHANSAPAMAAAATAAAVHAGAPAEIVEMMRRVRSYLREHSENVGERFADEARRIHYDEAEARTIHGQASHADVEALLEEGIDVLPVPVLPEDRN